jgi:cell wall-associated NlpC family hydrolase
MKKINIILRKNKKLISFLLVFAFLLSVPYVAEQYWATSAQDKKEEAEGNLKDVEDEMNDIKDKQDQVESELKNVRKRLSNLISKQNELEAEIGDTQTALTKTQEELEVAQKEAQKQYEAMKLRIKYMYENSSSDNLWTAIFEADGIADMLNRVEYVSQVQKSDRELLEEYKKAVEEVEILAATLEMEMNDLVTMREVYEHQEAALESALAQLEEEADNYEDQLATAKRRARELSDYIAEQNRLIALQQQQNNNNNNSSSGNSKPSTSGGYLNDPSYDPAFGSNVTGEELVNYALQFVGNPYKWGGNSLTNGCDCSGFVNLIYRHFGFKNVPRQSQAFKSYGQPVAFANIKAGDIVVYPGHVAIYIGNGKIVEAQSTRAGITCNRPVNCNTITAIRRVL